MTPNRSRTQTPEPSQSNRPATSATGARRIFALLAAGLMLAVAFTPSAAAAENGEHTVCLADSDGIARPGDPGTGCARGTIRTTHTCWDDSSTGWTCDVQARPLAVHVSGIHTCGNITLLTSSRSAMACTDVREEELEHADSVNDNAGQYTNIGAAGKTVVIPVQTCTWPNGANELVECETWNHTHKLPGNPNDHGGTIDFVFNTLDGEIEYVAKTVESADAPVGVSP